jgi:ribosomal protein L37AE/L43A
MTEDNYACPKCNAECSVIYNPDGITKCSNCDWIADKNWLYWTRRNIERDKRFNHLFQIIEDIKNKRK